MTRFLLLSIIIAILAGCNSVASRIERGNNIAVQASFEKSLVKTNNFTLTTYHRFTDTKQPLNIYIEGDGLAFVTRNKVSSNPTPANPLALILATKDPAPNVLYIARPCQYTSFEKNPGCAKKYWHKSRFAEEIIHSVNQAVSYYATKFDHGINIIGYSGGAAVATLVAARRNDVKSLRTVAGNLDHVAVMYYHNVPALSGSLNAIDVVNDVANIPQRHFIGQNDPVIPEYSVKNFAMYVGKKGGCAKVRTIHNATHHKGWEERWRQLLKEPVTCH